MKGIAVETYRRHIQQACGSGGYFAFLRVFSKVLDKISALFLQDLMNRAQIQLEKSTEDSPKVDADGYFLCTSSHLTNPDYMEWTEDEQRRCFAVLKKKEYVLTMTRGLPPKRWVWIDYVRIWSEIDNLPVIRASSRIQSRASSRIHLYKKNGTAFRSSSENEKDKHNVAPAGGRDATERDGIMFFEDLVTNSEHPKDVQEFDVQCADSLRDLLKAKKITSPYSKKKWSIQFRMLRTAVEDNKERILQVLKWYAKTIGTKYTPQALCATSFRKKFDKLEAAMRRDSPTDEQVEPSQTTLRILEHLSSKFWPKGSAEKLPVGVELSLRRVRDLLTKLTLIAEGQIPTPHASVKGFARDTVHRIDSPTNFVHSWFEHVNEMVTDWEKWSGDLRPFFFSVESKQFQKLGATWAREYSTDGRLWARMMEVLL